MPGWLGAGIRCRSDQQIDRSRVQFPTPQLIYFFLIVPFCSHDSCVTGVQKGKDWLHEIESPD